MVQACIISLDPVAELVSEAIDLEFWPSEQIAPHDDGDQSVLDADDPEPIENGLLEVGRVVREIVSASLPPYPRSLGAEMEVTESPADKDAPENGPFAALAGLKSPRT